MIQKCTIWGIFAEFAQQPTKPFQVRELARLTKIAHTSVRLHLQTLVREGLVRRERVGVYHAYRANREAPPFRMYKQFYNLLALRQSGIIAMLEETAAPDAIVLFGSYAKGEDIERSDIDLFLLAKEQKLNLQQYERKLGRGIQLFFTENLRTLPAELCNNIINGTVLSGFLRWRT